MAGWISINSSHLDSVCGNETGRAPGRALDGLDRWDHDVNETHWIIIDLGQTYTVQKVRGRSESTQDPIVVNIYVSDDKGNWGAAVASGVSIWQDTDSWQEVDTTNKDGQYVKVEIVHTEDVDDDLGFGSLVSPFSILDVYEGAAVDETITPSALAITLTLPAPTLIFPGGSSPSTLAATLTLLASSVVIGMTVTPATLTMTAGLLVPSVITGQTVTPSALALTAAVIAPSITGDFVMAVDTLALAMTLETPTVTKNSVTWSTGTLIYKGTSYSITAGITSDKFIYWDLNDSPTTFQTTDTLATALGSDKWVMMYNMDGVAYPAYSHKIIHGGIIQADTLTADHLQTNSVESDKIKADAVTATKINVVGLNGATGRIIVADATDADVVTGGINSYASTLITAGKIVVSGATNLDDWSHGSDATKIDGGNIYTDSIVTGSLAANLITYDELRQNAGSEAVDTGSIRDDATSLYETASTAADFTLTTSYQTIQTADITSLGGPIQVSLGCSFHNHDSTLHSAYMQLHSAAEGQIGDTVNILLNAGVTKRQTIFQLEYPGSGAQTYYIKASRGGTASIVHAFNRDLTLDESRGK